MTVLFREIHLRAAECRHMGSHTHSVICHPTQVDTPLLNPRQPAWYSVYLPWMDGSALPAKYGLAKSHKMHKNRNEWSGTDGCCGI